MVKIKWYYFSSLNHNSKVLCELSMPCCQLYVQKCSNFQKITKISKCLGVPQTLCQYTKGYLLFGVITTLSFKIIADEFNVAFWRDKVKQYPNYLVALNDYRFIVNYCVLIHCCYMQFLCADMGFALCLVRVFISVCFIIPSSSYQNFKSSLYAHFM